MTLRGFMVAACLSWMAPLAAAQPTPLETAYIDHTSKIIDIIARAANLTPLPPVPDDLSKFAEMLDEAVSRTKTNRVEIETLRDELDALGEPPPHGDADLNKTLSTLNTFAGKLLTTQLSLGADIEEYAIAFRTRNQARFEAATARLRKGALLSVESIIVMLRGTKVMSGGGDPALEAQLETVALVTEQVLTLMRYQLDDISMKEGGAQLVKTAAAIATELPIARSTIAGRADTFGDTPLTPPSSEVLMNRLDWRMLEIVEQVGIETAALGQRMSSGRADGSEIDAAYARTRQQMSEVRTLLNQGLAVAQQDLEDLRTTP